MKLAIDVYSATNKFPESEKYGLVTQMNRAVVSIASNIAEGSGRNSPREFDQFLGYALGSAYELETQLLIASDLSMIRDELVDKILSSLAEVQKLIIGLKK